jgi:hypothetical protein
MPVAWRDKEKAGHPTYVDMSVGFTFLGQFQLKLAMRVRKFLVLAHQVMVHVGLSVVHALQKCQDLKGGYQKSSISVQMKMERSVNNSEDPAQVLRTYPGPR